MILPAPLVALAWSALLAAAPAAAPAPAKGASNPYLASAIRLYNDLEFTAALEQLKKAEKYSTNPAEDILIHTYEGIVQANVGQPDSAEPDFKMALSLDLNAQLPKDVSPKIRAIWERVRTDLARTKTAETVPPPAVVPVATEPAAAHPAPNLAVAKPVEPAAGGLGLTVPALIAGGSGVAIAGTGAVLGLMARNTAKLAQSDVFQSDAASHLRSANQQQVVSYALIGVGSAAIVAAAAMFYLSRSGDEGSAGDRAPAKP